MKVCGIIMEANPLHLGHIALLEHARQELGADRLLIVLSGDHVQRGEPALLDQYARCSMLLAAGADLVLQLPLPFASGSAEYFARAAVSLLSHTAVCDMLLFGSECADLALLKEQAGRKEFLPFSQRPAPNDLLASAYLEALEYFRSPIQPHTLKRLGAAHDSREAEDKLASAALIRSMLLKDDKSAFRYMPQGNEALIRNYRKEDRLLCFDDYSSVLYYALLNGAADGYSGFFDVYPDLSDRFRSRLEQYENASSFAAVCKSKEVSSAHIRRALLHILLDIRKEPVQRLIEERDYCPYIRPLGFKREAADLLHSIRENTDRPILSKSADAPGLLSPEDLAVFETEMRASALYHYHARKEGGTLSEYRRSPVIL